MQPILEEKCDFAGCDQDACDRKLKQQKKKPRNQIELFLQEEESIKRIKSRCRNDGSERSQSPEEEDEYTMLTKCKPFCSTQQQVQELSETIGNGHRGSRQITDDVIMCNAGDGDNVKEEQSF